MVSSKISVCTDESAPSSATSMTMVQSDTEDSSSLPTNFDYYEEVVDENSNPYNDDEYEDGNDHSYYYNDDYDDDFDEDYIQEEATSQKEAPLTEPRLDSFDSYIVVSVLTATASFAALLDDNPEGHKSLSNRPMGRNFAILICAICSLSGIYSTVVFSFSSIYGRTAIGMGKYEAYESFLSATAVMRKRAFHMYLLSLVLFIVLLIIAAVDKIDPQLEIPFVVLLVFLSAVVYRDWSQIIVAAGVIFAPAPNNTDKNISKGNNCERSHGMRLRSQRSIRNDNNDSNTMQEEEESLLGPKPKNE